MLESFSALDKICSSFDSRDRIAIDLTQGFCFGNESQQMPCHVYNSCSYIERDIQNHLRHSLHLFSLCHIAKPADAPVLTGTRRTIELLTRDLSGLPHSLPKSVKT